MEQLDVREDRTTARIRVHKRKNRPVERDIRDSPQPSTSSEKPKTSPEFIGMSYLKDYSEFSFFFVIVSEVLFESCILILLLSDFPRPPKLIYYGSQQYHDPGDSICSMLGMSLTGFTHMFLYSNHLTTLALHSEKGTSSSTISSLSYGPFLPRRIFILY